MKPNSATGFADPSEEILALVRTLHETQRRLQELTGGQVDAVLREDGQSYLLHEAQEKLRANEESQRVLAATQLSILNALPAQIALLDPQGVIVAVNNGWRCFAETNGLQNSESCIGQNYVEICARALGDSAEEAGQAAMGIQKVLTGAATEFSVEYPCHSPTEQRWFQLMVTPLDYVPPCPVAVMHINITERKMAERQAAQQMELMDMAANLGKLGAWALEFPGRNLIWSKEVYCLHEVEPDYKPALDSALGFYPPATRVKIEAALQGGQPYDIESEFLTAKGNKKWVRTTGAVEMQSGAIHRFYGVLQDITDQKRDEMRFRRLVDSNAQGVFIWNTSGRITEANDALLSLSGYSREDLMAGRINWAKMTPEEFARFDQRALEELSATGVCQTYEKEWIRKDGSRVPILLGAAIFEDNREQGVCFVVDLTERKRNESRFRQLVDSNAQGVMFWKSTGEIVDGNAAFLRLVGYTQADLEAGRINWKALTPPEYDEADERALDEIGARGYCEPVEKEWIRKDGSRVPVYLSAASFEDTPGQGVTFAVDLTDRKRAEEAQRISEERFSHAFEYAPNGIILISPEGQVITANRHLCDLVGYSLGELSNKTFPEITHPDDVPKEAELIQRMLADEISFYQMDKRYVHKQGHEIWVQLHASLVRDANNHPLYFIKQVQNVTEIRCAHQQIAEQAALIDEASDAIFSRDLNHCVTFWGKAAQRILGWTVEEAKGQHVKDLLKMDSAKFAEADEGLRANGYWNGELQKTTKLGVPLIFNSRWTLLRDAGGEPHSILTIASDITERKKLEQQFLRAQRMESIGTLAGGIAHDLNNILAPIMMSIDVLKSISDKPEAMEILETIRVSAKRGADIVRQVLSFARGVEGKKIEVQPKHILEDVENIVKNTFPKSVEVRTTIPRDTWTILGDPTQIHQILLNLCVNARDAMPNGGKLTLTVENFVLDNQYSVMSHEAKPGPYVQISVTDSGTGIPPQLLERIFEPFFTTKEVTKGTGLGLSTVMAIVKSHEGTINVYSELGKGTTFKVYLPALESSPEKRKVQTQRVSLPRGNGETILVVDDEASILTITCQTLLAFGYRVLKAADGAEAVALYARHEHEVAVVLTDMMMPVLDGCALIHALKRINPAVKIIAASGLNAEGNVAKVTEAGVNHFLTKPYTAGTLLKTLQEILTES